MGFWTDRAMTCEEFAQDRIVERYRRAVGLTSVYGDEGRGLDCYGVLRRMDEGGWSVCFRLSGQDATAFIPAHMLTAKTVEEARQQLLVLSPKMPAPIRAAIMASRSAGERL